MNRIEQIKRDLPGLKKHFGTDYGWPKDIEYLLKIAECAENVINYLTPSRVDNDKILRSLAKALEGDGDERDVYNPELHEWRIHKLEPKKLWPAIIWDATCGKYFLTRCLFSDESIKEYDAPGQSVVRLATAKDFAEGFQMEDIE